MEGKNHEQEFAKRLLKYIEMFGLTQQENLSSYHGEDEEN